MVKLLSTKGELVAIKTKNGYGFLQRVSVQEGNESKNYAIAYLGEIKSIKDFSNNLPYYFVREFDINIDELKKYKKIQVVREYTPTPKEMKKEYTDAYYLGSHHLPKDIVIPNIFRDDDINLITGTYKWNIIQMDPWKVAVIKRLDEKTVQLPPYLASGIPWLIKRWETNFKLTDWNDEYIKNQIEAYYQKNPHIRPTDEKFDDVKNKIPKILEAHLAGVLETFIEEIEQDKTKPNVRKALKKTLKSLNKFQEDIETQEREEIFMYLAKVLRSLKCTNLIETIEQTREW